VAAPPNLISELGKVFLEARWLIKPDTSARENILYKAFRRETQQMTGILKPAVRRKVLRIASMASRRVGEAIGQSIAFAGYREAETTTSCHQVTSAASITISFDRPCSRKSPFETFALLALCILSG
jgi:hypothetical protein